METSESETNGSETNGSETSDKETKERELDNEISLAKTNSREHAKIVVDNLYKNGSDVRNGNPELLIEMLMKPRNIATCGVFPLLEKKDMYLIHDKSKIKYLEYPEIRKRVANIIYLHANKPDIISKNTKIYCRVSDYGMKILKDIINGTFIYKPRDVKVNFNIRIIFEHQERQKILGSHKG